MLLNINSHITMFDGCVVSQCILMSSFMIQFLMDGLLACVSGIVLNICNSGQMVTFPPQFPLYTVPVFFSWECSGWREIHHYKIF